MSERKFDELISYFNRKVSEMDIDRHYKMELLGMVSALGYAHEKECEDRKTGRWIPTDNESFCSVLNVGDTCMHISIRIKPIRIAIAEQT